MSFASLPTIPSLYETAVVCSSESEATRSVSDDFKASPQRSVQRRRQLNTMMQSVAANRKRLSSQKKFGLLSLSKSFHNLSNEPGKLVDEVTNGTTDLPVVDFADLDSTVIHAKAPCTPVPRRAPKTKRPVPHRHSSESVGVPTSSRPSPEPPVSSIAPEEPVSPAESMPTSPQAPHRRARTV